jgi:hypothetical protein
MAVADVLFFHGSLVHGSLPNTSFDRFRRSLIFHYVPESGVEVAKFYQPLISADGREVRIDKSVGGGYSRRSLGQRALKEVLYIWGRSE